MTQISDILSARQAKAFARIGDALFPGGEGLAPFSESRAMEAAVYTFAGLPTSDRRALTTVLSILSACPDRWLRRLFAPGEKDRALPGATALARVLDSVTSVVSMPYFAAMPWPAGESALLGDTKGVSPEREPLGGAKTTIAAPVSDRPRQGEGSLRFVVLGTLDTRGDEVAIVCEMIESRGHEAIVVDMGVVGAAVGEAAYTREAVAEAGGRSLRDLLAAAKAGADRGDATTVMVRGARRIVAELVAQREVDGIMGLGGSTAASSASRVMAGLPAELPKVLLTTFARVSADDILVVEAPVDLIGVNRVVVRALARAVGALAGMAEQVVPTPSDRPLVALTALGVTTPAALKVIAKLETLGYDAVVFAGTTEKLDRMVREGTLAALIDLTSFEMLGKVFYSDEQIQNATGAKFVDRARLPAVERASLPQVIAPGGLDIHVIPGLSDPEEVPGPLKGRPHARHGPDIMLVRTGDLEMGLLGYALARRVERATGPVAVVLPKRGFSDASRAGTAMSDGRADRVFIETFKAHVGEQTPVNEVDHHINDDAFAESVVDAFQSIMSEV